MKKRQEGTDVGDFAAGDGDLADFAKDAGAGGIIGGVEDARTSMR